MVKREKLKEVDLARVIVEYLKDRDWEVFMEVQSHVSDGRCDIYAKLGDFTWAIECKNSFGLSVIEQALGWRGQATMVSVAVPGPVSKLSRLGTEICRERGIGILTGEVHNSRLWATPVEIVNECLAAKIDTGAIRIPKLYEEQKTWAEAGNNEGKFFSPFQKTKKGLVEHVQAHGRVNLKEALVAVNHHYKSDSSAVASIVDLVSRGVFPELRVSKEGRSWVVESKNS
jgi:hypothetical protein